MKKIILAVLIFAGLALSLPAKAVTYSCPSGGTLSGATCVVPTTYTCSSGTLSGTSCLNTLISSGKSCNFSGSKTFGSFQLFDVSVRCPSATSTTGLVFADVNPIHQCHGGGCNSTYFGRSMTITVGAASSVPIANTARIYTGHWWQPMSISYNGASTISVTAYDQAVGFWISTTLNFSGSGYVAPTYGTVGATVLSAGYSYAATVTYYCNAGDTGPTLVNGVYKCQPPTLTATPTNNYSCVDADGQGVTDSFVTGTSNTKCRPDPFVYFGEPTWHCPVATGDPTEIVAGSASWTLKDIIAASGPAYTADVSLAINNNYTATAYTSSCPSGYTTTTTAGVCESTPIASTTGYSCPAGETLSGTSCQKYIAAATQVQYCAAGQWGYNNTCYDMAQGTFLTQWHTDYSAWIAAGGIYQSVVPMPIYATYFSCPSGYATDWDLVGTYVDMGGTCLKSAGAAPVGYNQTYGSCTIAGYGGLTLSGTNCYQTSAASTFASCPAGYSYTGGAIGGLNCKSWTTGTTGYSCPSGGNLSGATCVKPKTCPTGKALLAPLNAYCVGSPGTGPSVEGSATCSYTPPNVDAIYNYTTRHCTDPTHVVDATGMYCIPPKIDSDSILNYVTACIGSDVLGGMTCTPRLQTFPAVVETVYSCPTTLPPGTVLNTQTHMCVLPMETQTPTQVTQLTCGSNAKLNPATQMCDYVSIPALNVGGSYSCPAAYTVGVGAEAGWCIPTPQSAYPATWNLTRYDCPEGGTLGLDGNGNPNGLCYLP